VATLASKLLPGHRYITIDGYRVPLESVSHRAPTPAGAATAGGGSIYSRWVRAQDAKKKTTRKVAARSPPPVPRQQQHSKPSGWLADAPTLVKPRCPLRNFVDFPIRSEEL